MRAQVRSTSAAMLIYAIGAAPALQGDAHMKLYVAVLALLTAAVPAVAQILPSDPSVRCTTWQDGLTTCRNERTGERFECRQWPDGRTTCRKV